VEHEDMVTANECYVATRVR